MKPVYIIAEAGVNHNGSIERAMELINVAADANADYVKFQTFKANRLACQNAQKAAYQMQTTDQQESQFDMLKKLELTDSMHDKLIKHCQQKNIKFLSTPFDIDSVNLLTKKFNLSTLKIPSGEITNAPLLLATGQTKCNIILSTGMATLGEIEIALGVLALGLSGSQQQPSIELFRKIYCSTQGQQLLKQSVELLHCTTEYPAPYSDANLKAIDTMKQAFSLPVGLSDHTKGIAVAIAAAARGATIIEKHFTLDKNLPGPDHEASIEPNELKTLVTSIQQVDKAVGNHFKITTNTEQSNLKTVRKSLVASQNIKKGTVFSEQNITAKRPGTGISPIYYWSYIGKKSARDYQVDEVIE